MIIKFFETKKIDFTKVNLILFYGKNEGLKNQELNKLTKDNDKVFTYEEKEILHSQNEFEENILNKSLFEPTKKFIIKRVSDKIVNIMEKIKNKIKFQTKKITNQHLIQIIILNPNTIKSK